MVFISQLGEKVLQTPQSLFCSNRSNQEWGKHVSNTCEKNFLMPFTLVLLFTIINSEFTAKVSIIPTITKMFVYHIELNN